MTLTVKDAVEIDMRARVRVRVREEGLRMLKRRHDRFEAMLPAFLHKPFDMLPDDRGYIEMPLTEAVAVFGAALQTTDTELVDPIVQVVDDAVDTESTASAPRMNRLLRLVGRG